MHTHQQTCTFILLATFIFGAFGLAWDTSLSQNAHAARHRTAKRTGKQVRSLKKVYWRSLVYRLRWKHTALQRRIGQELLSRKETRAIPYLLGMLRKKKRPGRQKGALIALGQLGIPWTLSEILPLRNSSILSVRLAAMEALGLLCQKQRCKRSSKPYQMIVSFLLQKAQKGSVQEIKQALWSLAAMEATELRPKLEILYKSNQRPPGVALHFSRTLAALGHPEKRKKWQELQQKRSSWVSIRLKNWPGQWLSKLMAKGLSSSKSLRLRRQIAWRMLRYPSPLRKQLLRKACAQKNLSARFCKRLRHRIRKIYGGMSSYPRPWYLLSQQQITHRHQQLFAKTTSFARKLAKISGQMLGTPYLLDPLGEGPKGRYDRDPIFSFKRVDCVTFVEQLIGLAHKSPVPEAIKFTQTIRYEKGRINYRYRRHLPIAQWIPAMIRKGLGKDVTVQVGQTQTKYLTKQIDRRSYGSREGRRLVKRLGTSHVIYGKFKLPYLTLAVALKNLSRIPSGTVLSSLRHNYLHSPGQVTHQGLIIRIHGQLVMRHASSSSGGIVDIPFRTYLRILQKYPHPRLGIHLLQLLPPKAKAAL